MEDGKGKWWEGLDPKDLYGPVHDIVYGTRPFEVYGEGEVRYTRKLGTVYAIVCKHDGCDLTLGALGRNSITMGKAVNVELLGYDGDVSFSQDDNSLSIHIPKGVSDKMPLVFKIQSDKKWINDDDAGIEYDGWVHRYIKGSGNYDNDLHVAKRLGATISMEICGNKAIHICCKGASLRGT